MAPETIGRYEIIRPLGAGGMGEVFLAKDATLDRLVAIKRVAASDAGAAQSILHEARIVAALDHPHIASVFDVVEHLGHPHVVMEYVDGPTLSARAARAPIPEGDIVAYGRQIAAALAYAHARNVIHCDIKPSNVMLTPDDVPKVLDFGIARRSSAGGVATTRHVRGTPAYMAPEVLSGAAPTPQSDVFSLGVMLCELVAGRRPHLGETANLLRSRVSSELATALSDATAPDPDRRLQTAEELRIRLNDILSRQTRTSRVVRPRVRRAGKAFALATALAVICTALVLGIPRLPSVMAGPKVLGVMMFNNTGQEDDEYLASGLSDVLLGDLANAPGLTVVPRTAAAIAKENEIPEAVKALGLTHVLSGSVQRSGSILRITVSLLADKGATVKWSRSFDGPIDDVFHLERRISQAALQALRTERLITAGILSQDSQPTMSADAFDDYAHGRALIERADVPGNVDQALVFFTRAVERDPTFARAYAAIGDAFWRKYSQTRETAWVDRARSAMLSAMRGAPDDPEVGVTLATIDRGTGHPEDAIHTLENVIARQPAHDGAHRMLGRIFSERGDFDRAIAEFREALAFRPDYPATVRELGLAYYDKGRYEEAIATFTKLTSLQPDNGAAYQLLGTAYHANDQFDRALVAYHQANAIAPRATIYSNIGTIHYGRRQYRDAIAAYRQAIALQPKEATTHRNLADSLWLNDERAAARVEYHVAIDLAEAALTVNPTSTRMRSLAAYCHAKLGRIDVARAMLAEVVKNAPDDNDAAYKQAVVEALAGRAPEALKYLERALQLGYSHAMAERDRDLDAVRSHPAYAKLISH